MKKTSTFSIVFLALTLTAVVALALGIGQYFSPHINLASMAVPEGTSETPYAWLKGVIHEGPAIALSGSSFTFALWSVSLAAIPVFAVGSVILILAGQRKTPLFTHTIWIVLLNACTLLCASYALSSLFFIPLDSPMIQYSAFNAAELDRVSHIVINGLGQSAAMVGITTFLICCIRGTGNLAHISDAAA